MTDVDPMNETERRLRAELLRALIPPTAPANLREHVGRLAEEALTTPLRRRPAWMEAMATATRTMRFGLGAVAALALVAVALLAFRALGDRPGVAATPHPTLPAATQPALPSSPANRRC